MERLDCSTMAGMVRAFVALEPGLDQMNQLVGLQQTLGKSLGQAYRWTPPESMHLTLCFLGELPESAIRHARQALKSLAAPPIRAACRSLVVLPDLRDPRVLALEYEPTPSLLAAHQAVAQVVGSLAAQPEDRPFRPHLSLGRLRRTAAIPPALLQKVAAELDTTALHPLEADRLWLFRSELASSGARYHKLAEVPLCDA